MLAVLFVCPFAMYAYYSFCIFFCFSAQRVETGEFVREGLSRLIRAPNSAALGPWCSMAGLETERYGTPTGAKPWFPMIGYEWRDRLGAQLDEGVGGAAPAEAAEAGPAAATAGHIDIDLEEADAWDEDRPIADLIPRRPRASSVATPVIAVPPASRAPTLAIPTPTPTGTLPRPMSPPPMQPRAILQSLRAPLVSAPMISPTLQSTRSTNARIRSAVAAGLTSPPADTQRRRITSDTVFATTTSTTSTTTAAATTGIVSVPLSTTTLATIPFVSASATTTVSAPIPSVSLTPVSTPLPTATITTEARAAVVAEVRADGPDRRGFRLPTMPVVITESSQQGTARRQALQSTVVNLHEPLPADVEDALSILWNTLEVYRARHSFLFSPADLRLGREHSRGDLFSACQKIHQVLCLF